MWTSECDCASRLTRTAAMMSLGWGERRISRLSHTAPWSWTKAAISSAEGHATVT